MTESSAGVLTGSAPRTVTLGDGTSAPMAAVTEVGSSAIFECSAHLFASERDRECLFRCGVAAGAEQQYGLIQVAGLRIRSLGGGGGAPVGSSAVCSVAAVRDGW